MNRTTIFRIWRLFALAGLACVLAMPTWSAPQVVTESSKITRTFRVCLILLRSQTKPNDISVTYWNPDPWLLPVIQHSPFKPAGWELENPLAQGILTNDADLIKSGNQYSADAKGGSKGGPGYINNWYLNRKTVGAPLTKDDPAYWVVKLDDKSLDALADFDLIILNGHDTCTLSDQDRNYLRYLLERGATIWVNNSQRAGMQVNNFFLSPGVTFQSGPYTPNDQTTRVVKVNPTHWLLNAVYRLTDPEVNYLRDNLSARSYILKGVAGYFPGGENSQLFEVARLNNAKDFTAPDAPCIAAGRVGNGLAIITATDLFGAISDWWERRHNTTQPPFTAPIDDLNIWPVLPTMSTETPNKHETYIAGCKFFFNMLDRPSNWNMTGGNVTASRFYDQNFAATLQRGWSAAFTPTADPVSFNNFVALTGDVFGGAISNELRLYRTRRVTDDDGTILDYPYGLYTEFGSVLAPSLIGRPNWWDTMVNGYPRFPADASAESELDLCFVKVAQPNSVWVGSPVFGTVPQGMGRVISRTVVFALQATNVAGNWEFRPRCFAIDPYNYAGADLTQVGEDMWWNNNPNPPPFTLSSATGGLPRASMTLSSGRLVITAFGKTTKASSMRIYIVDARTGALRVQTGASTDWDFNFRAISPASLISAPLDFEAADVEIGESIDPITSKSGGPFTQELRRQMVEMLAFTGEFFGPNADPANTAGTPALFITPPTITIKLANKGAAFSKIPADLRLIEGDDPRTIDAAFPVDKTKVHRIGNSTDVFRKQHILHIKYGGNVLKITFRNWDVFFPQGVDSNPALSFPLTVAFTGDAPPNTPATPTYIENVQLNLGYPIFLYGNQHFPLGGRMTLHAADGDGVDTFGYAVDSPPLIFRDQFIVGVNARSVESFASLNNSLEPATVKIMRLGGSLCGIRLTHSGLSAVSAPGSIAGYGDIAWQFYGDTHGPRALGFQQMYWKSDFSLPAAAGKDAVYAVGTYDSYTNFDGTGRQTPPAGSSYGTLYALDNTPNRYLKQVVSAGMVTSVTADPVKFDATRTIRVDQSAAVLSAGLRTALRVGARMLLRGDTGVWDMGTIVGVRKTDPFDAADPSYWVTCDRVHPGASVLNNTALVATSVPYVSHVQAWNSVSGAEPMRTYQRLVGNVTEVATRLGEGICNTPPAGTSANPDPQIGAQEVMLELTELENSCHLPSAATAGPGTSSSLRPFDSAFLEDSAIFAAWKQRPHVFVPRFPVGGSSNMVTGLNEHNYTVDHRLGRIELSPRIAAELADRFILVHYFTNDLLGGQARKVRHAEIMYVPSPVLWQYEFEDAVPDSGPVVVNNTVYVSAVRKTATSWQPVLYSFPASPQQPYKAQPSWVQPLNTKVPLTGNLPYRCVTTPTPTPNGVLVGTALPNAANEVTVFSDRGTLIADGHRLLRLNSEGDVVWQASATKDLDPKSLNNPATEGIGVSTQEFTMITRMHKLPSGNILACDTGANRVVELDRKGSVVWQYPDSDITYQDPDRIYDTTTYVPVRSAGTMAAIRGKITAKSLRLNGPRDARRYNKDIIIPASAPNVTVNWVGPSGVVNLKTYGVTIRWESTLIADTGKNRILEICRPLVRIDDVDGFNTANGLAMARGFQYRPDVYYTANGGPATYLEQRVADVLVDGKNFKPKYDGVAYAKPLGFTIAARYRGPDDHLTETQGLLQDTNPIMEGVRTRELLAVVGNSVADPSKKDQFLRTVRISMPAIGGVPVIRNYASMTAAVGAGASVVPVDYGGEFKAGESVTVKNAAGTVKETAVVQQVNSVYNAGTGYWDYSLTLAGGLANGYASGSKVMMSHANALAIRPTSPADYARVWQLDVITLTRPDMTKENHVLVVDKAGVRQTPTDPARQLAPVFEMTQTEYDQALVNSGYWSQLVDARYPKLTTEAKNALKTKLTAWTGTAAHKDTLFAPVSVLRIDAGGGTTAVSDLRKVRYLIGQMNTVASPDSATWIDGQAHRRIHLFEARRVDPYESDANYNPRTGWGIIDADLNYFVYPDPLSAEFPSLPGGAYPLTQPLCIDRD